MSLEASAKLLVVTPVTEDARVVRAALAKEFGAIIVATDAATGRSAFDEHRPDVLILAFPLVESSKEFYEQLCRGSTILHKHPHRTILLCNKDEVRLAYSLCRASCFNDYVLYWPLTHDFPRLAMTVVIALRELAASNADGVDSKEVVNLAREVTHLHSTVRAAVARTEDRLAAADFSIRAMGTEARGVMKRFADDLEGESSGATSSDDGAVRTLERIEREWLVPWVDKVEGLLTPARQAIDGLRIAYRQGPQLEQRIEEFALAIRPRILVVEDEEMQAALLEQMLHGQYALSFAATGAQAFRAVQAQVPDLILMDVRLPDLDGVAVTRRLRTSERVSNVPIIVITGHSERGTVLESLRAGASDFIVKPFTRESLLSKIDQVLASERV